MVKFNPFQNIFKNPEFLAQNAGKQRYTLARWNEARQNRNLPRVFPSREILTRWGFDANAPINPNVTHKPKRNYSNAFITYEQAFPSQPLAIGMLDNVNKRKGNDDFDLDAYLDNFDIDRYIREEDALTTPSTSNITSSTTSTTTTNKPPSISGPAGGSGKGGPFKSSKKQKVIHESSESDNTADLFSEGDTDSTQNILAHFAHSISMSSGGSSAESMDTDSSSSISRASENPSLSGHNAASDGGFDSSQGPKSYIDKPLYLYNHGMMHFKVKHRLRVFAIPMTWPTAAGPAPLPATARYVITPMAYIPVDKIYFYMSNRQFSLIPPGSYIDSCSVTIDLLNCSTSFETGATASDTSTLSHIKTGLIGIDLDKKLRGSSVNLLNIPATMIPTISAVGEDFQEFVNLEYGSFPGAVAPFPLWDTNVLPGSSYGIQYNKYDYLCMYQQNQAGYTADGYGAANSMGHEYFQSQVEEFNVNDKLWDRIINYNYKFKNAPIGARFRPVELKAGNFAQEIGSDSTQHLQRSINNITGVGNTNYSESHVTHSFNDTHLVTYGTDTMEKGASNSKGSSPYTPGRQPTLYVGMRAIPKTTATGGVVRRTTNWVNADMTMDVTASMTIRTNDYPNRFTQPGIYNVSIENMELGSTANPAAGTKDITFGLRHN